jgi:hypothetical protein
MTGGKFPHPEFPLSTSDSTNNVHLTATECNCQSGFQCEVVPWATEGAFFASSENPDDRNCPSFDPLLRHFFVDLNAPRDQWRDGDLRSPLMLR